MHKHGTTPVLALHHPYPPGLLNNMEGQKVFFFFFFVLRIIFAYVLEEQCRIIACLTDLEKTLTNNSD